MSIPADPILVQLLERATAEALDGPVRESDAFWSTIGEALDAVPVDEVLAVAVTFCRADAPSMRATGAGLLAELGNLGSDTVDESLDILGILLDREESLDVIRIALHGVGLTALPGGIPVVLPFASSADPSVRLDATHALYSCAGEPPSREAIDALIVLSNDPDDDVRDWATFGLGTHIDADDDDTEVSDALAARLTDSYIDVREEAAVGLARRGDERAFEPVRLLLEADEVSALTVEAAGYVGDERFLRPLIELGEWWEDDSDLLKLAIARCDPAARARFEERAREVVDLVEQGFDDSSPGATLDGVEVERSTSELVTLFSARWTTAAGESEEAEWELESLFAHPEVLDDPARAAAGVLSDIREHSPG
jgi:hypothetical protein